MTIKIIVSDKELPELKLPIGKCDRYSIIHSGSKNGLVQKCELILKNEELNTEKFEKWMEYKLLPKISRNSLMVLDNAPLTQNNLMKFHRKNIGRIT
jgi:hypothetical protein